MKTRLLLPIFILLLLTSCNKVSDEINAREKNDQGLALMDQGEWSQAIVLFKDALSHKNLTDNTKSTILRNIGLTYHQIDELDSAEQYYILSANCFEKGTYNYLVNMAEIDLNAENIEEAIKKLNQAYRLNSDDLSVNNTLGLIYLGEYGDRFYNPEKALKFNQKAYEVNKDRISKEVLSYNYLELEKYQQAQDIYKDLTTNYPQFGDYFIYSGYCNQMLNKTAEAQVMYARAIMIDSSYADVVEHYKSL